MADYINGKEMYEELVEYHTAYIKSLEDNDEKPRVSNKLGQAFIQIATRLMNSFRFVNYTYKDEMISDAIMKCLNKVHTFDPRVSEQAFAYFTQICWNEALKRIKTEQHQSSVKAKIVRQKMSSDFIDHGVDFDSDDGSNAFVDFLKENDAYVDYEELKKIKSTTLPSLVHKNKTPYKKKMVDIPEVVDVNLFGDIV